MKRILAILALPLVAVGMLVAPLLGIHFCLDEAQPLLAAADLLPHIPLIGASLKTRLTKHSEPHCCKKEHPQYGIYTCYGCGNGPTDTSRTLKCLDCDVRPRAGGVR